MALFGQVVSYWPELMNAKVQAISLPVLIGGGGFKPSNMSFCEVGDGSSIVAYEVIRREKSNVLVCE